MNSAADIWERVLSLMETNHDRDHHHHLVLRRRAGGSG